MLQGPKHSMPANERRKFQRHRTLKAAKITFNGRRSVIDCTVRNLSDHGAHLQVANVVGVPERFDLQVNGASWPAKVIWRASNEIGVEFLGDVDQR